jgi:hypothetical protein
MRGPGDSRTADMSLATELTAAAPPLGQLPDRLFVCTEQPPGAHLWELGEQLAIHEPSSLRTRA